jgi:nucleotide-binding universal stress UspA family protein
LVNTVSGAAVVVGVDGSPAALTAVRLAAGEAASRRRPLRIVHAFVWPLLHVSGDPPPEGPAGGGLRQNAERIVAQAVAEAEATAPDLQVSGEIVTGQAGAVLLHEAPRAALIVIGDSGLGRFTSLLAGSVAIQVAEYAVCPLLIARGEERSTGPVVVGVDGSPLSDLAVQFAVEEAALHGTELVAVHAYEYPVRTGPGDVVPLVFDTEALRAEEDRVLAESVAGLADRYPEVPITRRLIPGRAALALIEESTTAQMIVVGARGRGGFAGLVLGSVSHAVLHHSSCPVAILRHPH